MYPLAFFLLSYPRAKQKNQGPAPYTMQAPVNPFLRPKPQTLHRLRDAK
jgi:hypothetical protein